MHALSKQVEIDGIHTSYMEFGEGETIVFLHGAYVRASTYDALVKRLGEKFHVIAPDLPGFGNSQTPHTIWSFTEYAAWLEKLLSTLRIEHATLVGHSFGGGIVLYTAAESSKVDRAIVIDSMGVATTHGRFELFMRQYILHTLNAFSSLKSITPYLCMSKDFFTNFLKRPFTFYRIQQTLIKAINSSFPKQFSLTAPLLIVWGIQDEIVPFNNSKEILSHALNSSTIEVDGFHDWLIYEPEKAANFIFDFIQEKNNV